MSKYFGRPLLDVAERRGTVTDVQQSTFRQIGDVVRDALISLIERLEALVKRREASLREAVAQLQAAREALERAEPRLPGV